MSAILLEQALLPDGWATSVRITVGNDGRFATVEPGAKGGGDPVHGIALPGMGNVHSHAFQRGMAGLAEIGGPASDDFWSWREIMYRFLTRLTPDDIEAITAQAYAEMLETGFTAVGEFHYLHHQPNGRTYDNPAEMTDRIAAAAAATGIAAVILPVHYAHGGCGGRPPKPGQIRFLTDLDGFARLAERAFALAGAGAFAGAGVAPHSLRAVSHDALAAIAKLYRAGPIHIHAAEQTKEVDECIAWSGQRPVEWLLSHQDLNERWCLIHATHMNPNEIADLAASGAVVGLCPATEANLGDGIFDASAYLNRNGRLAIGTDSNIRIDPADELRLLEYSQRLRDRGRVRLAAAGQSNGRRLFDAALSGGAQALGLRAGAICPGCRADFIVLDPDHPALMAKSNDGVLDGWVFAGGVGTVRETWVAGKRVVAQGRHIRRDDIRRRFRNALARLVAS